MGTLPSTRRSHVHREGQLCVNSCVFGQMHETWLMQLKKGPTAVTTSANVKQRKKPSAQRLAKIRSGKETAHCV